jgi:hypothetical protein
VNAEPPAWVIAACLLLAALCLLWSPESFIDAFNVMAVGEGKKNDG